MRDVVVTRDPDSGYINIGSYRYMKVNQNTLVAHIGSGHHGDVIRKKYWEKGKACPVAISLGQDPVLLLAAGTNLPWGSSEYGFAGWLRGEPVEVVKGEYTDLPIPATAEVVLEGDMLPPDQGQEIEGPFGEVSGYYGGGARPAPATKIKSMLFRNEPIILGAPPFLEANQNILYSRGILVWNELEALGIPNIMGVNYAGGARSFPSSRRILGMPCARPMRRWVGPPATTRDSSLSLTTMSILTTWMKCSGRWRRAASLKPLLMWYGAILEL